MRLGRNTNVNLRADTYHVQTEDHGASHPIIDTTVLCRGRVLHRRASSYSDLLPLDPQREHVLQSRLDAQHASVLEELRAGALDLPSAPT